MPLVARYALATLVPLALLILGAFFWGGYAVAALVWLTLVAGLTDELLAPPARDVAEHGLWPDRLSAVLAIGHVVLLVAVIMALAPGSHLGFWGALAFFFGTASFFGQVSHPNAHELIHRRPLWLRALGSTVYVTVGFGHHGSAHRMVHHRYVGTPDDPNTALPGEDFWTYLPRAWIGSFRAGMECEERRLERRGLSASHIRNPYWIWVGGGALTLIVSASLAGASGLLTVLGLGALTGAQILLSDYIQHYGLQRLELPNGRLEPVAAHHSWNAPRAFTSFLMLNAPSHSEHHMHPDRPYDQLDTEAPVPTLPRAMPVMAMIALVPPLWHRLMDRRAQKVMEAAAARIEAGLVQESPAAPRRPAEIHAAARAV